MSAAWFLGAAEQLSLSLSSGSGSAAVTPPLAWWRLGLLGLLFAALLGIWFYLNRSRLNLRGLGSLGTPAGRKIEVKEQRWLNSRTAVALIEVDGQRFLLAYGPDTASWQSLQSLQSPPSTPPPQP